MQKEQEKKAAQDEKRSSLHQGLEEAIQKHDEVDALRQKLEETRALHDSTIKELNRIHDDKLHSLEQELNAVRQEKLSRSGANAQVQERYRQDLLQIKKTHEQEVAQLLREHQEEVGVLNAQFEEQKAKAVGEFEVCYRVFCPTLGLLTSVSGQEMMFPLVMRESERLATVLSVLLIEACNNPQSRQLFLARTKSYQPLRVPPDQRKHCLLLMRFAKRDGSKHNLTLDRALLIRSFSYQQPLVQMETDSGPKCVRTLVHLKSISAMQNAITEAP
jgi:hypothetical protein